MGDVEFTAGDVLIDDRRVNDVAVDHDDEDAAVILGRHRIEVDLAGMVELEPDRAVGGALDVDEVLFGDFGDGADLDLVVVGGQ